MRKLQALREGEAGQPRSARSLCMQPNPIKAVTAAHSPTALPAADSPAGIQGFECSVRARVGALPSVKATPPCLLLMFSSSQHTGLPSGPGPSCPAGSRCPLPLSPPISVVHSPALQTGSDCPCRSRRKQRLKVRPEWSIAPTPRSHLLAVCIPQFSPYPWRTLVLAPTSTESRAFMISGEGNAGLGSIAYIWAEGPVYRLVGG
jgi:hypothetical protein